MAIPEPGAGRRTVPAGVPSTSGSPAGQADAGHAEAKQAETAQAAAGQAETAQAERPSVAVVIVPTLLGLLGFFAVAAAVTADAATVSVTVPGMLLALTALVVAGVSPLYARNSTWLSLRRPAVLLALCLLVEAALFLFAPQLVLFSLPALPLALGGGAVLLATSLWGQFRKGPAAEPVLLPLRESPPRPFTSTLLVVAVNWALFLAAGALCAWLLLGD
ncbi:MULTISPECIES: hypothetical protein [unclassified Arthrobacter]|uniref:hypothetical protein n=1 Tax=unclassified Arthrobacter TaxID=235627 RepID=UPI001E372AC0|nr:MULTISPECIES: hypothetical protein [unclassified Arthrobacter]MCC9144769.1 hypothetical protein [Arthrobacter sp. zg-Y919]MDK1275995.1 hypothetical protein [Arthrobacter sp. zg.Y919]WIB02657.1 hypothetical protein QNO10_11970 [Arthrobacter sp. zg-Y919]